MDDGREPQDPTACFGRAKNVEKNQTFLELFSFKNGRRGHTERERGSMVDNSINVVTPEACERKEKKGGREIKGRKLSSRHNIFPQIGPSRRSSMMGTEV